MDPEWVAVRETVLTGPRGGNPGKKGKQYIHGNNGTKELLEPIDGTTIEAGDLFVIETPGGGGFGTK